MNIERIITRLFSIGVLILGTGVMVDCGGNNCPRDDRGEFGDMEDALKSVRDGFLTANSSLIASTIQMGPFASRLLKFNRRYGDSCLSSDRTGRTYSFDGATYVGRIDPEVPGTVARFMLYELKQDGLPNTKRIIGHIDFACAGDPTADVYSASDTIPLGGVVLFGPRYDEAARTVGVLWIRDRSRYVSFMIDSLYEGLDLSMYVSAAPPPYRLKLILNLGSFILNDTSVFVAHVIWPSWRSGKFDENISFDGEGQVDGGFATLRGDSMAGFAACIGSGTLDDPEFTLPDSSCSPYELRDLPVTNSELRAMSRSHQMFREFWHSVIAIIQAFTPPAGLDSH